MGQGEVVRNVSVHLIWLLFHDFNCFFFHFTWQMFNRYYDGDRQKLFNEAHIIDPQISKAVDTKVVHDFMHIIFLKLFLSN